VPRSATHAEEKEPAGTLTQVEKQVYGVFNG
jgi:hypothetical protein